MQLCEKVPGTTEGNNVGNVQELSSYRRSMKGKHKPFICYFEKVHFKEVFFRITSGGELVVRAKVAPIPRTTRKDISFRHNSRNSLAEHSASLS